MNELIITIYNPTNFDAKVSVFVENSCDMNVPIGLNDMCGLNCFDVPSQQRVEISFPVGGTVMKRTSQREAVLTVRPTVKLNSTLRH